MSRSEDPVTDGGQSREAARSAEDIFNRVSDIERPPRSQQLLEGIRNRVLAPLKILITDPRGAVGVAILAFNVAMATLGVWFFPQPSSLAAEPYTPPFQSLEYPLGTASLGQEIHLQIIHATPAMLKFVISGGIVATLLGVTIGVTAGYKGGVIDYVLMLISDTWMSIPALVLILIISSFWSPRDPYLVGLMLGINFWGGLARMTRSEVLSVRESNKVEAARVMGLPTRYIIRKYVIKNLMPYITVNLANNSRQIIFAAVGLYFLGVLPYTSANWGVMMDQAYNNSNLTNMGQVHWLIIPMVMMILLTLGIILTAQAADKMFNVRLLAREQADEDEGATATATIPGK